MHGRTGSRYFNGFLYAFWCKSIEKLTDMYRYQEKRPNFNFMIRHCSKLRAFSSPNFKKSSRRSRELDSEALHTYCMHPYQIGEERGTWYLFLPLLPGKVWASGGSNSLRKARESDSTIATPQNQRFSSTNVSRLLDTTRKDTLEKKVSIYLPVCTGLSIDDVGVSRDTALTRQDRALVLKPAVSLKKRWGGYRRTARDTKYPSAKKHTHNSRQRFGMGP